MAHRVRASKRDRYSRRRHKLYKRDGRYGDRYGCDGCYVCAGVETARYSKRELGFLMERAQ
jgi:hypothetical protein